MLRTALAKKATPSTLAILIAAVVLVALYISYTLRSSGTYQDDDIAHYQIARWAWMHPELLLDEWGRPAWTLLYAPVAPFGLTAARIYSALLAGLVCVGSAVLAKSYGLRRYWLAAPLTGLQPEFVRQGFSTLTELSFALWLCVALIAERRRRWALMAFAAGWLPLARYESIPILALFLFILVKERRFGLILVALAPLAIWNGYWAVAAQDWRRIVFPLNAILFTSPQIISDYGSGPLWYYPSRLPVVFGSICFLLAIHGFFRLRFGMLQLCTIITIAVLSISYWKLPSTGIAGYIRHLAVLAPVVGVLATAGIEKMEVPLVSTKQRWIVALAIVCAAAASLGFAVVAWATRNTLYFDAIFALLVGGLILFNRPIVSAEALAAVCIPVIAASTLVHIQPFQLSGEQQVMIDAAHWYATSPYRDRLVLAAHTWFGYASGIDVYDNSIYRQITPAEVEQAPVGSLLAWDSHYSGRSVWRTPLSSLEGDRRLRPVRRYQQDGFMLYFYEKLRPNALTARALGNGHQALGVPMP
jgi:hypothetical protein